MQNPPMVVLDDSGIITSDSQDRSSRKSTKDKTHKRSSDSKLKQSLPKKRKQTPPLQAEQGDASEPSTSSTASEQATKSNSAEKSSRVKKSGESGLDEFSAWKLFFSQKMLDKIVEETNKQIEELRYMEPYYIEREGNFGPTNNEEMLAYLGLIYFRGLYNQNCIPNKMLFSNNLGHPVFGATMSRSRFEFLSMQLRFEDTQIAQDMWEKDTFAAFTNFFDEFNINCAQHIAPSEFLSMNEVLYPMSNDFRFEPMPQEHATKYGLVFKSLKSPDCKYTFISLVVKESDDLSTKKCSKNKNEIKSLIIELQKHMNLDGKQVVLDCQSTNTTTATWLLERGMTCIGPITTEHEELPDSLKDIKSRQLLSSETVESESNPAVTFNSFVVRKQKEKINELLLTTIENDASYREKHHRPAVYELYQKVKAFRGVVDQQPNSFTTRTESKRWTVAALSYVLDVCMVNAYVLLTLNKGLVPSTVDRHDFCYNLATGMIKPFVISRPKAGLNFMILRKISLVLGDILTDQLFPPSNNLPSNEGLLPCKAVKRRRCIYCLPALANGRVKRDSLAKIQNQCQRCGNAVCPSHIIQHCPRCLCKSA